MAAAAKPRATTSIHHVRIVDETGCCRGRYTCSSAGYNLRDLNICKALPKLPLQFSLPCVVAGFCVLLVNCTISPCSKQCEGLKVNDGRERSTNKTGFGGYLLSNLECKVVSFFLAIFNTHMTQHPEQTWFTFQMSRDAFPSRELSLSGSSRCSSQPPFTRRVGAPASKAHSDSSSSASEVLYIREMVFRRTPRGHGAWASTSSWTSIVPRGLPSGRDGIQILQVEVVFRWTPRRPGSWRGRGRGHPAGPWSWARAWASASC